MSKKASYEFKDLKCNICNTEDTVYIGTRRPLAWENAEKGEAGHKETLNIVKCRHCGLIYPNPLPIASRSQVQDNYKDPCSYFQKEKVDNKRLVFCRNILQEVYRNTGRKGRLLDVGCGRGELVYVAKQEGWDAEGIDISVSFANYAKEHFGLDVKICSLEDINFPNESFDVICLFSVLQHMLDPLWQLKEINRIMKKDGVLYMENMNNEGLVYKAGDFYYRLLRQKRTTCLAPTFPPYQIYGFSRKSIEEICRRTNFRILKMKIRGVRGGGRLSNCYSLKGRLLGIARNLVILVGGLIGQGHVLEVYARKGDFHGTTS